MAYPAQATPAAVTAAGLVRLTGLAAKFLYLDDNYQPTDEVVASGIDLRQKMESLALTSDAAEILAFLADLGETYDLPERVYTDPILRAQVPLVPSSGAQVRPFVLRIQGGKILTIQGGKALGLGYRLVPNGPPVYNTTLTPTQTVSSVAYNSVFATEFAFDGPVPALPNTARRLKLFVGTIQVGTVDFPSTLDGQGFSLLYNGLLYYGTFQLTSNDELVL